MFFFENFFSKHLSSKVNKKAKVQRLVKRDYFKTERTQNETNENPPRFP